jgi:hypothetical protein
MRPLVPILAAVPLGAAGAYAGTLAVAGAFSWPARPLLLLAAIGALLVGAFLANAACTLVRPARTASRVQYAAAATAVPAFLLTSSTSGNVFVRLAGEGGELAWPAFSSHVAADLEGSLSEACKRAVWKIRDHPARAVALVIVGRATPAVAGLALLATFMLLDLEGATRAAIGGGTAGAILGLGAGTRAVLASRPPPA